jgi:hypothetical protein
LFHILRGRKIINGLHMPLERPDAVLAAANTHFAGLIYRPFS